MPDHHAEGRIPRLSHDEALAVAAEIGLPAYLCDLSIFEVLLRHPPLAKAVNGLLSEIILHGRLDHRWRELVIMRVGWQTCSVYEWAQHWRLAQAFGVSQDELVGVRDWASHPGFSPADRAVLAATDEALETGAVSAATWARCEEYLGGADVMLELVTTIGGWQMISVLLRSVAVPLESDVTSWPPDGQGPR